MFRELIRKNKQLSEEECIAILKEQKRGVLSVNGDDGYPYGMPLNHYYNEEDGKIYFHSGRGGYKLEMLEKDSKVSFCVHDEGYRIPGKWPLHIKSVIVFGRVRIVDDPEKVIDITTKLSHKFTQDDAYIEREIKGNLQRTVLLELTLEYMTGKAVAES